MTKSIGFSKALFVCLLLVNAPWMVVASHWEPEPIPIYANITAPSEGHLTGVGSEVPCTCDAYDEDTLVLNGGPAATG